MAQVRLVNTRYRMVTLAIVSQHLIIAANGIAHQHLSHLLQVGRSMLPDEEHRDASEGVDEGEEEVIDEVLVVVWVEVVDGSHQSNQYLAELILTIGAYASILYKVKH